MSKIRVLGIALALLSLLLVGLPLAAQQAQVVREDNHGLSAPLRNMPITPPSALKVERPRPQIRNAPPAPAMQQEDAALQDTAFPAVAATPGLSFLGLGNGFPAFTVMYAPPDTNAAVGATQIVETVNISYAVFDKTTGATLAGPTAINNIWTGVDSSCSNPSNLSDPVVLYDQLAGRWVVEIITVSSPYKYCWAVSSTSDATGTYNAYAFTESAGLPDYAKTAIWPDAYYSSARIFQNGASYMGPKACGADRTAMLAGSPATEQCIQISSSSVDGMLPANLDGNNPPPAGSPEYFLLIPLPDSGTSNMLQLYQFHYVGGGGSTLTGPVNITVASYTESGSFSGFVPQSGTTNKLDGVGFSLMHRLAYRNFGGASPHESLVVTHNVSVGSGAGARYAPRWYEIRSPGTTPVVYQQGSYSPTADWRWMGSIAMDKAGDIALGYSASSSSIHPQIRFTGRRPPDPLGAMEAEATLTSGAGSQTGGLHRWGDYSRLAIDPVDNCTFWYTTEFIPVNGSFNWSTQMSSFKFNNCH